MSRVIARPGKSRSPTDRRHQSESLAAVCASRCVRHPAFNQKSKSLINNSRQPPLPCPSHVGAGALTCSAERGSANPQSRQRESIDTAWRPQLSNTPPLAHGHPRVAGCERGVPPPPLIYENNGLAATTASKSLSNKGLYAKS